MREVVYSETPTDVADAAAGLIFDAQQQAIEERGIYRIALSGGSTPRLLYEILTTEEWIDGMDWEKWEVFWGDERAVPPDHKESNYHLAQTTLLNAVPVSEIWRMRGEAENLTHAADEYARGLKSRFGPGKVVFDTILLGMGANGHTASLFPGHPALESAKLVEAVEVSDPLPRRITLTLPVLNDSRQTIFMITGQEKAERVRDVLDKEDNSLPAALVLPKHGDCLWLLDEDAAKLIR